LRVGNRQAIVEEVHGQSSNRFPAIVQHKFAILRGRLADDGRFDILAGRERKQFLHMLLRHRQHHALLRFTDPDFIVAQPSRI